MTDTPDLQRLAARYLDLWQEQVARMASDPSVSELMAKSYGMIKQRWEESAQQFQQGGDDRDHSAAAPGTPASSVPPDDSGRQLALLLERLAALEERLDRLEQAVGPRGKPASGRDKPRRSRKLAAGSV